MSFRIDQLAVYNLATVGNSVTAGSFVKSGGTSSQFLKADGSVDSNTYVTGGPYVPTTRTLTINGTSYDLSADRSWTITAGVSSVSGSGAGISVSPTTGAVVISNTGVTSNVAGTGISVSGSTGAVTITNTGVTSVAAGTGISVSASTGGVTITNAGVTSVNGNTGAITGIITTSNYNSYSPTLTGGGASGTWGISITGNADTVDGYHGSNYLGKNGNSYYQQDTWIQSTGTHGLYAPSSGSGTHWYPGTNATYGSWLMEGFRNNYIGIQLYGTTGPVVWMHDSSGNGGLYDHTEWYFYFHRSNRCMGVNGSATSSSYAMYVNSKGIYSAGDVVAYSDARKKTDIVTIDNALDKVMQLRGVYYLRIDQEEKGRQTGVIAQEIQEVLPEVVTYAADVDEYGVSYGNIVGVLIEAIKEQQSQIEDLKKQIEFLADNR